MTKKLFWVIFPVFLVALVFPHFATAEPSVSIAEIQGEADFSPLEGKKVTVQGVVTALRPRGFYIQTPDDKIDNKQKTSEGIYVFTEDTPSDEILPGKIVEVSGTVAEFRPEKEIYTLFLTEIVKPEIKVLEDAALPDPVVLTKTDLNPEGQIDQLERFEGMRVKIDEIKVVAPTGGFFDLEEGKVKSNGVFFGVLAGIPRPFREPGLDTLKVLIDKLPQTYPVFDMNPELIRIDSDGLNGGKPIDVAAGATIKGGVGIIDYSFRAYTLLLDPSVSPTVEGKREYLRASPAGVGEITIASINLENFFDEEENSDLGDRKETKVSAEYFEKRLKKASLAVRNVLSLPDVLGIAEVENEDVLIKLANRINADAESAGQPNPNYAAILEEGNDLRGIDVGFLIKTSRIKTLGTKQLGKELLLEHADANPNEKLFSRPPLLAEFETDIDGIKPNFKFTVVVNHFKSYRGINSSRVQEKRRSQAEFLANQVSERQTATPDERIILIGDLNGYQFNDGYNDLVGTLKGTPEKNVLAPAKTVYKTGLINLVEYITASNRYSYVFAGSAQTLDHILINKPTQKFAAKFGYARLNADFPRVLANDETRPERISDHDAPVLYLSIGSKTETEAAPNSEKSDFR